MFWFLSDLLRCQTERTAIERLTVETTWLREARWTLDGADLCLHADITVDDKIYPIRMTYPPAFPATPPTVRPRGPSSPRWSDHQYGAGGELCLEWGPDTWHPGVLGAQVLESAHKLLRSEGQVGATQVPVPSRHLLSVGQELRQSQFRFGVSESMVTFIRTLPESAKGTAELLVSGEGPFVVLVRTLVSGDVSWVDATLPASVLAGSPRAVTFLKTGLSGPMLRSASAAQLNAMLMPLGIDIGSLPPAMTGSDLSMLLLSDSDSALHLYYTWGSDPRECFGFTSFSLGRVDAVRLSDEVSLLSTKRVGIVGLGSIGSKIAIALARTGVRRFVLVDDDVVLPGNICRNELDWGDVGLLKVEAVARAIGRIQANVDTETRRIRLTGQEATATVSEALNLLTGCDLILDATACPRTFNLLAQVATQYEKPLVWSEVFGGGIGGLVARSRPRMDPTPFQVRQAWNEFTAAHPYPQDMSNEPYGVAGDEGDPRIATDADVSVIAAHATQFALDAIVERVPSRFPYCVYLLGLARGWVFDQPFSTIPIDVGIPVPTSAKILSTPTDVVTDVQTFITGLLTDRDRGPAAPS